MSETKSKNGKFQYKQTVNVWQLGADRVL